MVLFSFHNTVYITKLETSSSPFPKLSEIPIPIPRHPALTSIFPNSLPALFIFSLAPSMPESRSICSCCAKFIISASVIVLCGWLSFRFVKPRYYLLSFSFPTTNSSSLVATFQLEIENKNRQIGIYHDDINLTLLAGPNLSSPLSRCVVPAFYQGYLKTAEQPGNFSGISNGNRALLGGESAVFRVSANSAFRFKVLGWKSRHHAVNVSGDVGVDVDGKKIVEQGIRLSSSCAAVAVPVISVGLFLLCVSLLT